MSMRIDCGEYQLLESQRNLKALEPLEFIDESIYDGWDSNLEHLMIANNSLSDFTKTQLSIESLFCLRTISIGSDCFENVTVFQLNNLPVLKSLVIGEGSFTPEYWWKSERKQSAKKNGSFLCCNCPNLTTLVISPNAFVLYSNFTLSSEYKRIN